MKHQEHLNTLLNNYEAGAMHFDELKNSLQFLPVKLSIYDEVALVDTPEELIVMAIR